jgi:hypothetical protein
MFDVHRHVAVSSAAWTFPTSESQRPLSREGRHLREGVRCGFCSKQRGEVDAMFEGPTTFICNECVMMFAAEFGKRRMPALP